MSRAPLIEFEVADAEGVTHRYEVTPHGADEGFEISARLVELGAPVILAALEPILAESDATVGGLLDVEAAELVRRLPLGDIAGKLGPLVAAMPKMRRQLLKNAARDGVMLSKDAAFNAAYQRNYGELFLAIGQIVVGNGFLPLPATSGPEAAGSR